MGMEMQNYFLPKWNRVKFGKPIKELGGINKL